jgi:hypothetical protein
MHTRKYRQLAYPFENLLKRGFYVVRYDGRDYAVRQGYHLLACVGEAHANPMIDNCGVCAPLWGVIPVPLCCGTLDDHRRWRECAHLAINARVYSLCDGDRGHVRSVDVNRTLAEVEWDAGDVGWYAARDLGALP